MTAQRPTVSVIGGHEADDEVLALARGVGRVIAGVGAVLVCGGLSGVMEAAAQGAREEGGLTIGLLPGKDKAEANPNIEIALPTSLGYARNVIVACSADLIVALPGSHGTRSEISYGLVYKRPVVDLGGWGLPGMIPVEDLSALGDVLRERLGAIRG